MKIIFVDIDGPLLPGKMHLYPTNKKITFKELHKAEPLFDNFAVQCFNIWTKYADAKIVFSTNWATHPEIDADHLKMLMSNNGIEFDGHYHDDVITLKRFTPARGSEIWGWLTEHHKDIDTFIAVDDDYECRYIKSYMESDIIKKRNINLTGKWINVDFAEGMTWENFTDGCEALGIDLEDVNEQEFGIKKLTAEEKEKQAKSLEMLIHCMV